MNDQKVGDAFDRLEKELQESKNLIKLLDMRIVRLELKMNGIINGNPEPLEEEV